MIPLVLLRVSTQLAKSASLYPANLAGPSSMPGVEELVLLCAGEVPQYLFHRREVIITGFLHEPAQVPDREREVRPGVQQVPQRTDDATILSSVDRQLGA
jgi:hypothetical protein